MSSQEVDKQLHKVTVDGIFWHRDGAQETATKASHDQLCVYTQPLQQQQHPDCWYLRDTRGLGVSAKGVLGLPGAEETLVLVVEGMMPATEERRVS